MKIKLSNFFKSKSLPFDLILFCFFILILKLTLVVIFPDPMFLLGDSHQYLISAESGAILSDRSYLYGFIIGPILKMSHSLYSLVWFQTLLSCFSCFCLLYILTYYIQCHRKIAFFLTFIFALEPNQLIHERFLLTENVGGFAFSLFLLLFFAMLKKQKLFLGVLLAGVSILVIALRMAYFVPVVLGTVILFVYIFGVRWPHILKTSACILMLLCAISSYKLLNSRLAEEEPSLISADGLIFISSFTPLLSLEMFEASGVSAEVFHQWKPTTRFFFRRCSEFFNPTGLVATLRKNFQPLSRANQMAKRLATRCLVTKPLQVLKLGLSSYLLYFDKSSYAPALVDQFRGFYKIPENKFFRERLLKNYGYALKEKVNFWLVQYYQQFRFWFLALLIFPLIGTSLCFLNSTRSENNGFLVLLFNLNALILFLTNGDVVLRYLHPLPILFLLWLGELSRKLEPIKS